MNNQRSSASVIGVDIGGANLKLADGHGNCLSEAFPMWTHSAHLARRLSALITQLTAPLSLPPAAQPFEETPSLEPSCNAICQTSQLQLALTMTGEMADCFPSRAAGVRHIVTQVAEVVPESHTHVYAVDGRWLTPRQAIEHPWEVAASNWHALASWIVDLPAFNEVEPQLVLDIGSTTVDVIPIAQRRVATQARADRDRLQLGQLVYTGIRRTPIAAILNSVSVQGQVCPLVAEAFATSDDAYLVLGLVPESAEELDTSDGKPRTAVAARQRLARMLAEDADRLPVEVIESVARQVVHVQAALVARAIQANFPSPDVSPLRIVVSGHGRPLVLAAATQIQSEVELHWLDEVLTPAAARCAPAVAVAALLQRRFEDR